MHDDSPTTGMAHDGIDDPYPDEAKQRWGHTEAYRQSQERVKKLSKEDMARIKAAGEDLTKRIAACAEAGKDAASPEAQALIAEHFAGLRAFYEPTVEMYHGLGDMYVQDPRFAANYDTVRPGLAVYMRDAMHAYCDARR